MADDSARTAVGEAGAGADNRPAPADGEPEPADDAARTADGRAAAGDPAASKSPRAREPVSLQRRRLLKAIGLVVAGGIAGAAGAIGLRDRSAESLRPGPAAEPAARPTARPTAPATASEPAPSLSAPSPGVPTDPASWFNPDNWADGRVPEAGDVAVIDRRVLLDGHARISGVELVAGGVLEFAPTLPATLESSGNVVVMGGLVMRPADETVHHLLRFIDVDERAVAGGNIHEPLDSDVGLWVIEDGVLDLEGTPRAGWNRTGDDPSWLAGDETRVAPSAAGDFSEFAEFAAGQTPPSVSGGGTEHVTEVFNLTRNVAIEGTESGRAHIIVLHARQPQTIRWAAIRHIGPRSGAPSQRSGVDPELQASTGRYGLHFHHCGDGSRGSVVEGVVVRDCGNHAFVPHGSHGITFRDCIAYKVSEDAYWWDPEPDHSSYPSNASHDTIYEHCAAFDLEPREGSRGFLLTGFHLGQGERNVCVDCVAVGCRGLATSSGFHWPSTANGMPGNVWEFSDCVAHNNARHGIFVWQNDSNLHVIERYTGWRNGASGINHGAYLNRYDYRDLLLFDNPVAIIAHAGGRDGGMTVFSQVTTPESIQIVAHPVPFEGPMRFVSSSFGAAIAVDERMEDRAGKPGEYEFIDVKVGDQPLAPEHFDLTFVAPGTRFRVQNGSEAYELDEAGTARAIAPFVEPQA